MKTLDLSEYENASTASFELIKADPILNGGLSLDSINEQFSEIHKSISHSSIEQKFPFLSRLPIIHRFTWGDIKTKLQWFEGKLSSIFISYDENYDSLQTSVALYEEHIESISVRINTLESFLKEHKEETDEEKLYGNSIRTLLSALIGGRARMTINLDTANEITLQMQMNKPIFQTIINSLVIEKTWEIGLKAAQNSIDVMNKFIRTVSTELTDWTIAFSKEINKNKYDNLNAKVFQENINKLKKALIDIDEIKKKAVLDYEAYKIIT